MTAILGLFMVYVWVHSVVLIITKTKNTKGYDKFVLISALVLFILYILGTI